MPALRPLAPAALPGLAAVALAAALTACSGGSVKQTVDVTIGDDACDLGSATLEAGKTAFDVKNDSGKEAEAYVYTADGDKVDEVEGIADGTSRTLTVSLDAGSYEFACKPEGSDVRTPFTVS
jgi:iron uptake system component EfeO